jgi:hypothetical protein
VYTLAQVRDDFYHRHEKAERVKATVADLVRLRRVQQTGGTFQVVEH